MKRKKGVTGVLLTIVSTLVAVLFLFPVIWALAVSFKKEGTAVSNAIQWFLPPYTAQNYPRVLFDSKVPLWLFNSVVIALVGLYLLCMTGSFSLSKGDFLILICSFCFSIHIMIVDHFSVKVSGTKLSCIQFFISAALSAIPMFLLETPRMSNILQAWLPILYAGILSCGVAYTFQIIGQKGCDPTIASLILSLESVVSVLAGWVILHQSLSAKEITGCVLMFAAIILAQVNPKKQGAGAESLNGETVS